jgi:beta-galactosidase
MIVLFSIAIEAFWLLLASLLLVNDCTRAASIKSNSHWHLEAGSGRERISLNTNWRFRRWESNPDKLAYASRPDNNNIKGLTILKPWILPAANDFINSASKHYMRPSSAPSGNFTFAQLDFDDKQWESVDLPHDWANKGPFYTSGDAPIGGGMGRLPVQGVGWYRRKLTLTPADLDRSRRLYLDVDGVMSYAMVWLNGELVGGWPYGYNSFRLDLTQFAKQGDNLLAIRVDNPVDSSRWYTGGGVYRNVWLTKVDPLHVAQWGTFISTRSVSKESAIVDLTLQVENRGSSSRQVQVATHIYTIDTKSSRVKVAEFPPVSINVAADSKQSLKGSVIVKNPQLWGPPPTQTPNLYVAITWLSAENQSEALDTYETQFGIRTIVHDANNGLLVNSEHIRIQGVNQHHDLGALGAAFNLRAAQRQLGILRELGANAIRFSHNPPAPELLDLTDQMGFVVIDEAFDCWEKQKTTNDMHLIFGEWSEADMRSMLRRDRNHPSIIVWSIGNEVGEQTDGEAGAAIARRLCSIVHDEDGRPCTASMNAAKANTPFPAALDLISLNYQGEGIRDAPAYEGLPGITAPPSYLAFHSAYKDRMILSSETAAALSTRGTYFFPVTKESSAPWKDTSGGGGNATARQVSAYELYTAPFGASADKVFATQDRNTFVAGEFVWSGWDYLGEPTPYYSARSSYFGIIDLAGFKKERFFLYQARWRPDLNMAKIIPMHWNWPDRVGQTTPVHVFSGASEAELFLNGQSLGRKKKDGSTFRFRWDEIQYESGELRVVTYKDGQVWATDTVRTTGAPAQITLAPDRTELESNGQDLVFITANIVDDKGDVVKSASNTITFEVKGPAELVATDNGNPYDMTAFPSTTRKAFSGSALAIIRSRSGASGQITIQASSSGLQATVLILNRSKQALRIRNQTNAESGY